MAKSEKKIRPTVVIPNTPDKHLPIELFQNEVLRPILKLQHSVLFALFHHTERSFSNDWGNLKKELKLERIETLIMKNGPLRNVLVGVVVGQLEEAEMKVYLKDKREYDRRIVRMVVQRIQSCV